MSEMMSPVWMDGPLAGQDHEIPYDTVMQGVYLYRPDAAYTFTLVNVLNVQIPVGSCTSQVLDPVLIARSVLTREAQRAAGMG